MVRGRRTERRAWWTWTLCLLILAGAAVHAASPAEIIDRRQRIIELRRDVIVLEARQDALMREYALRRKAPPTGDITEALPAALRQRVTAALQASPERTGLRAEADRRLARVLRQAETDAEAVAARWQAAQDRALAVRERQARVEARLEAPLGDAPPLLPAGRARLWLAFWAAGCLLAGVYLAAGRRRRDRLLTRSLGARPMHGAVGLCLLGLAVAVAWEAVYHARRSAEEDLPISFVEYIDRECDLREAQRVELEAAVARAEEPFAQRWRTDEGHGALTRLLELALRTERLRAGTAALDSEADRLERWLDEEQARHADWLQWRGRLRAAGCAAVVALAFVPWLVVTLRGAWRRAAERRRCPVCATGRLGNLPAGAGGDVDRLVGCPRCGYRIPRLYRSLPRLNILGVGLSGSGKTHWLVEAFHQISRRNLPAEVVAEPLGPAERMAAVQAAVQAIWDGQGDVAAALAAIPAERPLLLHVKDRRRGDPGALLHLFEAPGGPPDEIDAGRIERTMGVLLFLDPTRPVAAQQRWLDGWIARLRAVWRIGGGRPVPLPVAVCLSRLDLVPTATDLGALALPWLERLCATMRSRVDRALLLGRSELVRAQLPALFPGWNLARTLEQGFGAVVYFPMSPVGIAEDERLLAVRPGDSLRDRFLMPFGILEPLLWLMHRRGYDVLD